MPAVIPAHVALRSRLQDSAGHALTLDQKLHDLITERPARSSGTFHGKIDHSQPPWHAPAAGVHLEFHALSRKLEKDLRRDLGLPWRPRGGSDANTRRAAEALCRLGEKADDFLVRVITRELDKWCRRASLVLEETEIPRRLPRQPGQPEPPCPWCRDHTLRMLPVRGEVRCINPGCRDDRQRRPRARLEYSEHVGEVILLWQDDIAGIPA